MNFFKATIRKLVSLPLDELAKLFQWGEASSVISNSNLLVGSATCDGEPVAFLTAEPVYIVSSYALSPTATPSELQKAGDALDSALAETSQNIGASRFLIVVPEDAPPEPGERVLRVIERSVPTFHEIPIAMNDGTTITKTLRCSADNSKAEWVN